MSHRVSFAVLAGLIVAGSAVAQSPRIAWHRQVCGGPVNCVAISPNGQIIAAGGDDGTVTLWRASDGGYVGTGVTASVVDRLLGDAEQLRLHLTAQARRRLVEGDVHRER